MSEERHLRPEMRFGYRNRLLTPEELRIVDAHLSACEPCRESLAREMDADGIARSIQNELREESGRGNSRSFIPYAAAAAVVLAASAAMWFAARRPALNAAANMETPEQKLVIENVLQSGRLPLPDFMKDLAPPDQVLMGAPSGDPKMKLLSPVATAVLSARPTFRWEGLEAGWTYVVKVFRPGFELADESAQISGSDWTPVKDLPSGVTYEWQILATRGDRKITFPSPPQVPPRFRVVDSATAEKLRGISGHAHLLLAIEDAKAGLIDDARRELREELRVHGESAAVRRLLDSLDH